MLLDLWGWVGDLKQGQATVLGLVGGFFTLVVGALINARLNRNRDDRLRKEDQRAVATALRAELVGLQRALKDNAAALIEQVLEKGDVKPIEASESFFLIGDASNSVQIMPEMVSKLGLLDQETIERVIDAYAALDGYYERLVLAGGRLEKKLIPPNSNSRLLAFPADKARAVTTMNDGLLDVIQKAIDRLGVSLSTRRGSRLRRAWRWMRATG
jgi:hypothetical protein